MPQGRVARELCCSLGGSPSSSPSEKTPPAPLGNPVSVLPKPEQVVPHLPAATWATAVPPSRLPLPVSSPHCVKLLCMLRFCLWSTLSYFCGMRQVCVQVNAVANDKHDDDHDDDATMKMLLGP